jgi:hypothetical protein
MRERGVWGWGKRERAGMRVRVEGKRRVREEGWGKMGVWGTGWRKVVRGMRGGIQGNVVGDWGGWGREEGKYFGGMRGGVREVGDMRGEMRESEGGNEDEEWGGGVRESGG